MEPITMLKRICVTAAVAAAALSVPLLLVAPAHAEDERHCVSKVEYHEVDPELFIGFRGNIPASPSRQQLERAWDVRRLGHVDPEGAGPGQVMWVYPACGFSYEEGQVWVIVDRRDLKVAGVYRFIYFEATPHGRP